jgi:hypothetical protein
VSRARIACLASIAAAIVALGCTHAQGQFHGEGPRIGSWTLAPDTCIAGSHHGLEGADLFRTNDRNDTEIVIAAAGFVLARVPGANKMVAFTREDCRILDVDMGWNGVRVNGTRGIAGNAHIECERAGVGKIEGYASFSCN